MDGKLRSRGCLRRRMDRDSGGGGVIDTKTEDSEGQTERRAVETEVKREQREAGDQRNNTSKSVEILPKLILFSGRL